MPKKINILVLGRQDSHTSYVIRSLRLKKLLVSICRTYFGIDRNIPQIEFFGNNYPERRWCVPMRKFMKIYVLYLSFAYLSSILFTFLYLRIPVDLIIAIGPFNGFLASLLHKKFIYYSEDKIVSGIKFGIVNNLSAYFDNISRRNCSMMWVVSPDMLVETQSDSHLKGITYFMPMLMMKLPYVKNKKDKIISMVFVGNLTKVQGCDLLLDVLFQLRKENLYMHLNIIGRGEYEDEMRKYIKNHNLDKQVTFHGFISDEQMLMREISKSDIGLALYNPLDYPNLAYGQSNKIMHYCACGLPSIVTGSVTNTPYLARYIMEYSAGFVCNYSSIDVRDVIIRLVHEARLYTKMRGNTQKIVNMFSYNELKSKQLTLIRSLVKS